MFPCKQKITNPRITLRQLTGFGRHWEASVTTDAGRVITEVGLTAESALAALKQWM